MRLPSGLLRTHHNTVDTPRTVSLQEIDGELCVIADFSLGFGPSRREEGTLDSFLELAEGNPRRVAAFVQRHGPLEICEAHGLPWPHEYDSLEWFFDEEGVLQSDDREPRRCEPREVAGRFALSLPVATLRAYAVEVRAVLAIDGRLRRGEMGRRQDWEILFAGPTAQFDDFASMAEVRDYGRGGSIRITESRDLQHQRTVLSAKINSYLALGRVRPSVLFVDEGPMVRMTCQGVFGLIALQLFQRMTSLDGPVVCSGCGTPYRPTRKPAEGRKNWCPECREAGVPNRHAQRARRSRNKAEDRQDG